MIYSHGRYSFSKSDTMKPFSTLILLFTLGSLFPAGIRAQSITLKESETSIKGPHHEILPCPGGDYITVTYPFEDEKDPVTVSRFDAKLSQRYTNPIQDLASQHFRAAFYENGRLFLLCNNKEGAVSRYEVNDKTGALTGSPAALFDLEGKEEDVTFFSGSSPDKASTTCW